MALQGLPADWRDGSKIAALRDALSVTPHVRAHIAVRDCAACETVIEATEPQIGTWPIVFRFKRNGEWHDRPLEDVPSNGRPGSPGAKTRLRNLVYEVHAHMVETGSTAPVAAPVEPAAPVAAPIAQNGFDADAEKRFFWTEYERIQTLAHRDGIDSLKYRPAQDAGRMISAGIPARACLHAMAMHWEDADRRRAGIENYDPSTDFPGGLDAYLDALAASGVLIMLVGPAGVGKSFWAKNLAKRLDVDFGAISMTEGASPSWLLGRQTLDGYKPSKFVELFAKPSVFLLDELDAADANMALVINDPLANGMLDNPVSGDQIHRDRQNVIVATANTLGTGSDDQYAGRNQLDFATLDRFRMGRVHVDYNRDVARELLFA